MRMFNPHFVLVSAVALLGAASCTLITDVDRKKIPPPSTGSPEGGQGATGGSAGTGGTGGTAAEGGNGTGEGGIGGDANGGAGEAGAPSTGGTGGSSGSAGEAGNAGSGGAAPVCTKASGTITLQTDPHTFFRDGDRFTVADGVGDAVTFEFDCFGGTICNPDDSGPSNGSEGIGDGREAITFDGTEDESGMAALIVSAINDSDLRVTASIATANDGAGGAGGEGGSAPAVPGEPIVIELAHELFGDRGNAGISERINNPNFTTRGLSGGEAVSCPDTVTACSDGDACESGSCDTDAHLCE